MNLHKRRARLAYQRLAWGSLCLGIALPASAVDIALDVIAASEYTSNSARTQRDQVDEFIHSPGVSLVVEQEDPRLTIDVNYDFERRIYQEDLFEDDNVATGTASLIWNALPRRLDFVVDHTRSETLVESVQNNTPDNRQESTTTSAGPILRFNPRSTDILEFQYQWAERSAETTERIDASTEQATIRYVLTTSPTSSLSLEAIQSNVDYEESAVPDVDYETAQFTWSQRGADAELEVVAGYTQSSRSNNRDDVNSPLFGLILDWRIAPATRLSMTANHEIRDRSATLSNGLTATAQSVNADSALAEVFQNQRAAIDLQHDINATNQVTAGIFYNDEQFEDVDRDTRTIGLNLGWTRRLNPSMTLLTSLTYDDQKFIDFDDTTNNLGAFAELDWIIGPRLSANFGVRYEKQRNDDGRNDRGYDEWTTLFSLTYRTYQFGET